MSGDYQPPYTLNSKIVSLVSEISNTIGRLSVLEDNPAAIRLRRINRIKTIQGSLAIEGNTLSKEQITAILDGKQIIAPARDVQEVRNAIVAYEKLADWDPCKKNDLLAAHKVLMRGLLDIPGAFRLGSVGIMKGKDVVHLAPPAENVPGLINDLLIWLQKTNEQPLIASSVFHYEFEFIHPFEDGNGRLGRLWQTLILSGWEPLFAFVPVETLVYQHQADYYQALNVSDTRGESAVFIEFMLKMIRDAVQGAGEMSEKTSEKIVRFIGANADVTIAQLAVLVGVSTRSVERNLKVLRDDGVIKRVGPDKGGHWVVL